MSIAVTGDVPYYAVIFTSLRTPGDHGDGRMAEAMVEAASRQPGFLGVESARKEGGITVSYWQSLEAIAAWKRDLDHLMAQRLGREQWYQSYRTRICKVERDHGFTRD